MSFKLKLVAFFVLLALMPLAAAFAGFDAVVQRSEVRLADARLQSGLRAAIAAYQQELVSASRTAAVLGRSRVFQDALIEHDRGELRRILSGEPYLRVEVGTFRVGRVWPGVAERRVIVVGPAGIDAELGTIVASVPLDAALAGRLHARSGREQDERVIVSGRDEFSELAAAFNDMAMELQARVQELETERRRLKDATLRFGEALSATHDVDQLLRAVVETAVDSTGATGGLLVGRKGELVKAGDPTRHEMQFELPIVAGKEDFGRLVLSGPRFSVADLETAALLVG